MSVSEWEIRKLDQRHGEIEDRMMQRHPELACPNCGCGLIIARGVAGEPMQVFPHPTCPNCGFERKP